VQGPGYASGKFLGFCGIRTGAKSPENDSCGDYLEGAIAAEPQKSRTMRHQSGSHRGNSFRGHPSSRQHLQTNSAEQQIS